MWISGGDHELGENIVHLVLAKIAGSPPGVRGISLFLVPKYLPDGARNDVALAGLNHKMGYRGTVNTVLSFGERHRAPSGVARRGAPPGPRRMFQMMNEARVAVGAGAVALGYTGYLKSLDYARTRTQGRPPGREGPDARRRCRSWSTPTCAGCCSRRRRSSKAGSGSSCTAASSSTRSARPRPRRRGRTPTCCSTCSRRSRRAGPRSTACRPTTSRSRSTAATATPASTTSSSTTGTTGSTRSTRARTGSRPSICSAARS